MRSSTIQAISEFEAGVQIGQPVWGRFTNGHPFFNAPATVVRISPKSFSVTINAALAEGTAYYTPPGTRVNVPRFLPTQRNGWSANNRIAPTEA